MKSNDLAGSGKSGACFGGLAVKGALPLGLTASPQGIFRKKKREAFFHRFGQKAEVGQRLARFQPA